MTTENNSCPLYDYEGVDLLGFRYNKKYPPNKDKFGEDYDGYATKAEGVLFYDFAVQGYDVEFSYKGKKYYLLNDGEAYLSDSHFTAKYEHFDNPMDLVEHLKIDGKTLISIMNDLDDIEPV